MIGWYLAVATTAAVFVLLAILGALVRIEVALRDVARATRETPVFTRPSSFRRES